MNASLFILTVLAGGVGAAARFVVDGFVTQRLFARRASAGFPWGIFVVNLTGSLGLGLLIGASSALGSPALTAIGTGFLGGYTTFSTAMVDTLHLIRQRRHREAWANGAGMLVACVAAAACGMVLGRAL